MFPSAGQNLARGARGSHVPAEAAVLCGEHRAQLLPGPAQPHSETSRVTDLHWPFPALPSQPLTIYASSQLDYGP